MMTILVSQMKYMTIVVTAMVLMAGYGTSGRAVAQNKTVGAPKQDTSWYSYSKHYDEPSETYYFLTRIKHKDSQGKLKKIKLAQSTILEGETVRQFAERVGATLAFNASMGIKRKTAEEKLFPVGIQIEKGQVVQEREAKGWRFTLGIKANNELVVYPPGTTATEIRKDGAQDALTAFIPLIQNYKGVDDSILNLTGAFKAKHPRQIIAQMENLDIVFLSCGGRGYDGQGMTSMDIIRILKKEGVKFAFMLDGGGSTSVVVYDTLITKKIDKHGTKERLRPNFLYFD